MFWWGLSENNPRYIIGIMNLKEAFLETIGKMLERVGFLPPEESPEYYGYGAACEQFGDCRDCDDDEELELYMEIFCRGILKNYP